MKLLKTYLRNSMTDHRLTGLALMCIHTEVEVDIANVIRRLMAMPARAEAMRQAATDDTAANTIGSNTGSEAPPIGVGRYLIKVSKVSK